MCCSRRTTKVDSLRNVRGVKSAKKVGNNTFEVIYKDGCKAIRLHRTDVVTYRPDGACILNTDGWQTRTTKDRINKYANVRVVQDNHKWFVYAPTQSSILSKIPYRDYMIFDSCGFHNSPREELHNHEKGGLELC
jgi:hypothetical protein